MYGPRENTMRLPAEDIDTTMECSYMSTLSDGSRSGLPLWGSRRSFKVPLLQEKLDGRTSPVLRDDMTVSTSERTTRPATPNEMESLGYLELLGSLPCMQNQDFVCSGPMHEQMWESETQFTQTLMRKTEERNTLTMTNYAILLHNYHSESLKASLLLDEVIAQDNFCIEALNAYGALVLDVSQRARRDSETAKERDFILDNGNKWGDRASTHPNAHDHLCKMQHKVT